MQKKVREAQLSQYNYIFVIGEQEKVRYIARGAWAASTGGCLLAVVCFVHSIQQDPAVLQKCGTWALSKVW
jgi:hypothetical protein